MTAQLAVLCLLAAQTMSPAASLRAALVTEVARGGVLGAATDDAGRHVAKAALAYLGRPYRFGGQDPRTGIDCASFVRLLFRSLGFDLPYTAAGQMRYGRPVAGTDLAPGDLVFFHDTFKRGISHVGVYLGDGRFIHAAGRKSGIIISALSRPFYSRHFAGARRLLAPSSAVAQASEPLPAAGSALESK
jgi:cell wall-associated NlpC family hydrolase